MLPKKNSSFRVVYMALVVSRIIIGIWIWYVFFSNYSPLQKDKINEIEQLEDSWTLEEQNEQENQAKGEGGEKEKSRYYIDQDIILEGNISKVEWFKKYTHNLVDKENNTFWIKSADVDLFKYTWEISIKWVIMDIEVDLPIIMVSEANSLEKEETRTGNSWTYTFYKNAGIGIDLTLTKGYESRQNVDEIVIVDVASKTDAEKTILGIAPFDCENSTLLKDCSKLSTLEGNRFVSSNNISFTQIPETSTRIFFNTEEIWYYAKAENDELLKQFADTIQFINEEIIISTVKDQAEDDCRLDSDRINTDEAEVEIRDGETIIAQITAPLLSDKEKAAVCTYKVMLWQQIEFELLTTEITNAEQNDAEIIEEGNYEGWLSFSSVRWYTAYFSETGIAFEWAYLNDEEKIEIEGLSCDYWIRVITWANVEELSNKPDSIIYECSWNEDVNTAALPNDTKYLFEKADKHFVKKDITTAFTNMDVEVVIKKEEE